MVVYVCVSVYACACVCVCVSLCKRITRYLVPGLAGEEKLKKKERERELRILLLQRKNKMGERCSCGLVSGKDCRWNGENPLPGLIRVQEYSSETK